MRGAMREPAAARGAIGPPRGSVSDNLCYRDAYARETQAQVLAVDPESGAVLLDRTVFYPGGGGQPADQAGCGTVMAGPGP